jgi:cell division protein FtsB
MQAIDLMKRAMVPATCLLAMGYFLNAAISGPSGVQAWRSFETDRERLQAELAQVSEQRRALERQVDLLDPQGVDPDLAEELVRRNLNVVKPDEVIITLGDKAAPFGTE